MITYISADWIFTVQSKPIKHGVLALKEDGEIVDILPPEKAKDLTHVKKYKGVLVPGFINTHCHLELSHLANKIDKKIGLTAFIKQILSLRQQPEDEILKAMKDADAKMYDNGIVAVGDISNGSISKQVKLNSKIYYHTFIEVLGFNRPSAPIISQALQFKKDFAPLKSSIVPHAPYSVSESLLYEIKNVTQEDDLLSIHNQETTGENELFEFGTGKFATFFQELGIAQHSTHNSGKTSIHYHLPKLAKNVNTLLVHNTMVNQEDLFFAKTEHGKLYWCLCPNANIFIENTLPDVALLQRENVVLTLGTDSLASNHQLNILSEMQTLETQKNIAFSESIKWATLNGAKFLGIDNQYGSLEIGKKPGIVLIDLDEDLTIKKESKIKRLF